MFSTLRRRWACFLLLTLAVLDLFIADPLPFLDEALLAGLTAACFRRHGKEETDPVETDGDTAASA